MTVPPGVTGRLPGPSHRGTLGKNSRTPAILIHTVTTGLTKVNLSKQCALPAYNNTGRLRCLVRAIFSRAISTTMLHMQRCCNCTMADRRERTGKANCSADCKALIADSQRKRAQELRLPRVYWPRIMISLEHGEHKHQRRAASWSPPATLLRPRMLLYSVWKMQCT